MGGNTSKNSVEDYTDTISNSVTQAINSVSVKISQDQSVTIDENCCNCINANTIRYQDYLCAVTTGTPTSQPNYEECTEACENSACNSDITGDNTCEDATDLPSAPSDGGGTTAPSSYISVCGSDYSSSDCTKYSDGIVKRNMNRLNKARVKAGLTPFKSSDDDSYESCIKAEPDYSNMCTVSGDMELDQYMSAQISSDQENSVRTTINNSVTKDLTQSIQDNLGDYAIDDTISNSIKDITCTATFIVTCDTNWSTILLSQCQDVNICGNFTGVMLLDSVQDTVTDLMQSNSTLQNYLNDITDQVSQKTTISGVNWSGIVITIVAIFFCLVIVAVIVWLWKKYYKNKKSSNSTSV